MEEVTTSGSTVSVTAYQIKSRSSLSCVPGQEGGEVGALWRLAVRGSFWTVGSLAVGQALRLGSNLILARLLFPEAFGLLALVNVFIQGLQLFSDFGIRGSVIHNPRGDDQAFLNTAWTLRVIRGAALSIFLCILAWPVSRFYEEPRLLSLMPVVALTAVVDGFASTAVFTLLRHVRIGRLALLELAAQTAGVLVMIVWAAVAPSVWALVAGALTRTISRCAISHVLLPGYANRFAFDREAARMLFVYGRWIFLATALTFIATQADRAVLGKFLTASQLGVYSIAALLSLFVVQAVQQLSSQILFPVYAKLARDDRGQLRRHTFRIRVAMLACFLPVLWCLVLWGQGLVDLLYDVRYTQAGWMLRILAAGAISTVIIDSSQAVVLAHGDSFQHMWLQLSKALLFLVMGAAGGIIAGVPGFLIGISGSRALAYPTVALSIRRFGTWLPMLDGTAFALSAVVVMIAIWKS